MAPASSFGTTPSTAGIHSAIRPCSYAGRVKRSCAAPSAGWWSPQPMPPPVRKNPSTRSRSAHSAWRPGKTPIREVGAASSARTAAYASVRVKRPVAGS
ncbi:hypothetical protein O1L60_37075 [Streptomyces diastatochromogenes]|nr:hypothetical protein [Streptomyces diastatochromogenes]